MVVGAQHQSRNPPTLRCADKFPIYQNPDLRKSRQRTFWFVNIRQLNLKKLNKQKNCSSISTQKLVSRSQSLLQHDDAQQTIMLISIEPQRSYKLNCLFYKLRSNTLAGVVVASIFILVPSVSLHAPKLRQ